MKKITLLIGLAFLLGFGGMAQKNQVKPYGLAPQKNIDMQNIQCKHSQKAPSYAKLNYQHPIVDISKGLKSSKGLIQVLILTPDYAFTAPIVTGLAAFPDLQITVFDTANFGTFSVADLLPYDVVFAYNDYTWESAGGDRTVVGDVLKDYLDAGGKVVENEFLKSFDNWGVAGGYVTGNYSAFGTTTLDTWAATALGTVLDPLHPVMTGVTTLTNTFDDQDPTLAAGATEIADWADGYIAIAVKPNVVSINMMPYDPNGGVLGFTGDGFILYHNAIVWLAGAPIALCDISPIQITAPLNSDSLTTSDSIRVKVANNDSLPNFDIPITYVIDGGTPYNDIITDTIAGQSFIIFTFQQPYDFSAPGHIFNVEIYTAYSCDTVNSNDTLLTTIYNDFDAASLSIDMVPIIGPGTINPLATFENTGSISVTFDVTMNIDLYTSTQTVTNLVPGATQQVIFDPWTATIGNYTVEVYTQLANDMDLNNDTLTKAISVQNMKKAYCYIAYDPSAALPEGPAIVDLNNPATIISLADQTGQNFLSGGAWANNHWYAAVYTDNNLVEIDTLSGARTIIGPLGVGIYGLSYDQITGTLYGIDGTSLYTINTTTGAATLVGDMGVSGSTFINLACNSTTGIIYSVNITDDKLYRINKTTGAATLVGAIGFDASYAQGMEFHPDGTCYMAAYNATSSSGELRTVNTSTGTTTLIGAFAGGAELDAMAIPGIFIQNAVDAGVTSIIAPSNDTTCVLSATENITVSIMSFGTDSLWNFDVSYQINSGTVVTETISDTLLPFGTLLHTFATTEDLSAVGAYIIKAYTGVTGDMNNANDTTIKTVISADASITVNIQTDNYGNETTWELINNTTSQVVATGGPYASNAYFSTSVCVLSSDCFTFNIYDSFGDGICCAYGNGTYEIQWDGISLGVIPGSFTTSATIANICQPQPNDVGAFTIDISNGLPGSISPKGTVKNYGTLTQSFSGTLTINPGGYTSTQNVTNLAPGQTQQLIFSPNWNPTAGTYSVVLYTTLPGGDANTSNDTLIKSIDIIDIAKKAYGYIAYDPSAALPEGPAILDLDNPGTIISLADQTGQNFLSGGAWANNHWYAAVYTDNNLIEIDTITGARTVIGPLGVGIYGLSYDQITGTLFGTDGTSLYTINITTGAATLVGNMGVSGSTFINLACNSTTGIIYTVNITDDNVYRINKTTGAATLVGAIGFDASYAQGMEFHPDGTCYMAAYNATSSSGELRTINTTTGATTLVGAFPGGAEIDAVAISGLFTQNAIDAGVVSIIAPSNDTSCVLSATENITISIMSFGTNSLSNFNVSYQINSGTVITETVIGPLLPFGTLLHTFATTEDLSAVGAYVIKAYTGVAGDMDNTNDTITKTVMSADASITVNILTDNYGSETTWDLVNNTTSQIVATGGPYASNAYFSTSVCVLSSDCFTFNIYDSFGDGICCAYGNGTYEIVWDTTSFGVIPGSFTTSATITNICDPYAGIEEATMNTAVNVFPNPAKDVLNILSSENILRIILVNAFGQPIFNYAVNGNNTIISTSSLSDGIYYLQIETADGITSRKISVIK